MTQADYEEKLTSEQRMAMLEVFSRKPLPVTWPEFLRSAFNDPLMRCVLVPWSGMILGIEPDGHTHS
jgi:hypothetical protein